MITYSQYIEYILSLCVCMYGRTSESLYGWTCSSR